MRNNNHHSGNSQVLKNQDLYFYQAKRQYYRLLVTNRYAVWVECARKEKRNKFMQAA
jgi:hypothetical protein